MNNPTAIDKEEKIKIIIKIINLYVKSVGICYIKVIKRDTKGP